MSFGIVSALVRPVGLFGTVACLRLVVFTLIATIACAGESQENKTIADAAFSQTAVVEGNRIHYAAVEDEEDAMATAAPNDGWDIRAAAVANARMDFLLHFPDDSRGWLVAGYLFLPPANLDLAGRVHYMRTIRSRLAVAKEAAHSSERLRHLLLIVEAFHELGKLDHQLSFRPSTVTRASFERLSSMLASLQVHAPGDSSVKRLTNYHAEILARASKLKHGDASGQSEGRSRGPAASGIEATEIALVLRLRWPWELAELHNRWSSNRVSDRLPPWTAIMLQEQKDRDALLLLETFIQRNPDDAKIAELVSTYLYITPDFIASYPENTDAAETWEQDFQALPRDESAKRHWLLTGDALVDKLLVSTLLSAAEKEMLSAQRMFRDLRNAAYGWEVKPDWPPLIRRLSDCIGQTKNPDLLAERMQGSLKILSSADQTVRENFHRFLEENPNAVIRQLYAGIVSAEQIAAVNQKLRQVRFTSLQEATINLVDYRGKVVLLDFWATWCTPCVAEMPIVKAAWEKYRAAGFEVIGISGDFAQKERVLEFLADRNYEWPQHYDGKGTKNQFATLLGVSAWPTTYLIGKDGKVIEKNVRGERLEPAVRKALGLEP